MLLRSVRPGRREQHRSDHPGTAVELDAEQQPAVDVAASMLDIKLISN